MTRGSYELRRILFLQILVVSTFIAVTAGQDVLEILPEWKYDYREFSTVALSEDGDFLGTAEIDSGEFYFFQGDQLLWNYPVGYVHSISISQNGEDIAVGADNEFFLFNGITSNLTLRYDVGNESLVAISSDGNYAIVGARSDQDNETLGTKLYVFKKGQSIPVWTKSLEGDLESVSICSNGSYFVISTSFPGMMYVFATEQETPMWSYLFGNKSGGARISSDGSFIVAVGGDPAIKDNTKYIQRIFQFSLQSPIARYQKYITEVPSHRRLSVSSNGSVFASSFAETSELILYDMNVEPYGPSSIHQIDIPASPQVMSMSDDGRYIFIGTLEGLFIYQYSKGALELEKQYTTDTPLILDIDSSSDGRYVAAVGEERDSGNGHSFIYFFDTVSKETEGFSIPLILIILLILISAMFFGIGGLVLHRKISKNAHVSYFNGIPSQSIHALIL